MLHSQSTYIDARLRTPAAINGRRFSSAALIDHRRRAGLSRAKLGAAIGRSDQSIRLYELDKVQPPIDVADRIAVALGVPLDALLTGGAK